ncbi:hypothetical protein SAMN06272721_102560 [Arthrobacter sp. P2b]|nr:hypothetical protein SAMN06272721_102560 [Arthrobacter sp. P2b]
MDPLKPLGVTVLSLDVTDHASMRAAVGRVLAERGRIEVLVSTGNGGGAGAHQQGRDTHTA